VKRATQAIYGLFGALAIALGLVALLVPRWITPPELYSPFVGHLTREQGAEGIFVGMMSIWCLLHLEERRPVHLALLLFTALFAAIHWAGYFEPGSGRTLLSPLMNTVPFVMFLIATPRSRPPDYSTGPLRR